MDKDEAIKKLEQLFYTEIGKELNEEDYGASWMRFLDYSLIIADEVRKYEKPLPQADVRKQLGKLKKALDAMGPQALHHIEQSLGFPDPNTPITAPSPIAIMQTAATNYKQDRTQSLQNRRLIHLAQNLWVGECSRYKGTRFADFVVVLAALAGIRHFNADILRRGVSDTPRRPRFNPDQL
jgi:hypothetical protein